MIFFQVWFFLMIFKCDGFSNDEKSVILSLIEYKKPYAILLSSKSNILNSKSLFLPQFIMFQIISPDKLDNLATKDTEVPTMVLARSNDISENTWFSPYVPSYIWVIVENNENINLEVLDVPYNVEFYYVKLKNTEGEYEIIEKYNIGNSSRYIKFGTWSRTSGSHYSKLDFYSRRMNTQGAVVKIQRPFLPTCSPLVCNQREFWGGLEAMMNLTSVPNMFRPDVFTESANSLLTGQAFATVPGVEVTIPPLVGPMHTMRVYMHVKAEGVEAAGWLQFFKPFDTMMWFAIGAWLMIASLTYIVIYWVSFETAYFTEHLFAPLFVFCNQGESDNMKTNAARIVDLATSATSMIILPTYSATLLALIMITHAKLPFLNLNGLMAKEGYKIAGLYDTFSQHYMMMENNYEEVVRRYFAKDIPMTLQEALDRLCSDEKFVFLGYNNFVLNEVTKCRLLKIPNHLFSSTTSLKLKYGSPFKHVFNRNLIRFYTSGVMRRMSREVEGKEPKITFTGDNKSGVDLVRVLFPISLLVLGMALSFILLSAELLIEFLRRREIKAPRKV